MIRRSVVALGLAAAAPLASCRSGAPEPEKVASLAPSAPPVASVKPIRPEDLPEELRVLTAWPIPTGPRLAVLAGEGVGAVRLGANVATIERLMAAPCEEKTPDACRYIGRGVEFFLKDGVTVEIHAHRSDRQTTPKGRVFGVFNGRTPEGVAFMMLLPAVRELLGPPLSMEAVRDGGEWNTVEIQHYKGMRLEFDRMANGNVVLGGIVILKAGPGKPAPSGATAPVTSTRAVP